VKDCGVAVTMSQGAELTASCFEWIPVNVGTIAFRPSPVVANGLRWTGTSSAAGTRRMQAKLHWWAIRDPGRVFDDLHNLVYDPAFLVQAWERVHGNKGGRTAGVDGVAPRSIPKDSVMLLTQLRCELKARTFRPMPVREKLIPKPGSPLKKRRLGIPTTADRVVQAALKLVPEADIEACFDTIDHTALMDRVRRRVTDSRVLALVKAFLKAGILSEDGLDRDTSTGTPQGGLCAAAHNPPCGTAGKIFCGIRCMAEFRKQATEFGDIPTGDARRRPAEENRS